MDSVFKSFWYGPTLSPLEWVCLSSFTERGLDFHLYTYDEDIDVPSGVTLKDAGAIYPKDEVFFYQRGPGKGSVAAFANLLRYKLLHEFGGWWVDMDVMYTGAPLPSEPTFYGYQDASIINNAILCFPEKHPLATTFLQKAEELGKDVTWGQAGPQLVTRVIEQQGLTDYAYPPAYAYPVPWHDAPFFYDPDKRSDVESRLTKSNAPFVHLWNEILGRVGIQKSIAPPKGSYIDRVALELGVKWPNPTTRYSPKAIRNMHKHYSMSRELTTTKAKLNSIVHSTSWKVVERLRQLTGREPLA
jgi:hypothetical protein